MQMLGRAGERNGDPGMDPGSRGGAPEESFTPAGGSADDDLPF